MPSINLGNVRIGSAHDFYFPPGALHNHFTAPLEITTTAHLYSYGAFGVDPTVTPGNLNADFTWLDWPVAVTFAPGEAFPTFHFRFTPRVLGACYYLITVKSTILWGPTTEETYWWNYVVTFTGVEALPKTLSVQPSGIIFPDTEVNEESEFQNITIINNGANSTEASDVTITALTPAAHYALFETPILPYVLAVGESLILKLRFAPTTAGDKTNAQALAIVSDATQSPQYVGATAYGYTTAISTIDGLDARTLLSFAYGEGPTVAVKEVDSDDLNCEEAQNFDKLFEFDLPGQDKTITDYYWKYENEGAASLAVTVSRRITAADEVISQRREAIIGSAEKDHRTLVASVNGYTLDGEMLNLNIHKEASSGPFSLVEEVVKFLVGEKLVGSYSLPVIISSIAKVNLEGEGCLMAFCSNVGVTATRKMLSYDLNCEEAGYWEKLTAFDKEGLEKALMRLWLKVEDLGPTTITLDVTSPRASATQVSETFGTADADEDILNAVFNVIFSGEMLKLKVGRAANGGAFSMVNYMPKVEVRGELVEA